MSRMSRSTTTDLGVQELSALAQVRGYWEALRHGAHVPSRLQVDPRGIEDALSQTFILDRIAPGHARFRIAGMHLADLMGMDVRGMPLSSIIEPSARAGFAAGLEQVFAHPALLSLDLEAERGIGRPSLSGRMLILPLADEAGLVRMALGCLVTAGTVGRGPRRFFTAHQSVTALIGECGLRLVAEAGTPLPPRATRGRGHLRLV